MIKTSGRHPGKRNHQLSMDMMYMLVILEWFGCHVSRDKNPHNTINLML